jgi:hypothetical protein
MSVQLGMPFGTACGRLRKEVMFELVKEVGKNFCFRCGEPIESSRDLTLDHKEPWRHSENAKDLFFSVANIAFSHWKCNTSARRVRRKYSPEEAARIGRERTAAYMRKRYTTERRREKYRTTGH